MDQNLANEMRKILDLEDTEAQTIFVAKILGFLESIPIASNEYLPLIVEFINKAYELLPCSNLPMNVSKKYNVGKRRRKISFGNSERHDFLHPGKISAEGLAQRKREAGSLLIFNLDKKTRFTPKECFVDLKNNSTNKTLFLPNAINKIDIPIIPNNKKYTKVELDLKSILKDPSCLEIYLDYK